MFPITQEIKEQFRDKRRSLALEGKTTDEVFVREFIKARDSVDRDTDLYRLLWKVPRGYYVLYGAEKVIDMVKEKMHEMGEL